MPLLPEKFAWMAVMFILLVVGIKKYEGSVTSSSMAFRPGLMKIHVKVVSSISCIIWLKMSDVSGTISVHIIGSVVTVDPNHPICIPTRSLWSNPSASQRRVDGWSHEFAWHSLVSRLMYFFIA
jgi:hypothetical protein